MDYTFILAKLKDGILKLVGGELQTVVSGSSTITVPSYAIQFHEDSVVSFINGTGTDVTSGSYPKGQTIFGSFSSITWVSGRYTVYSL